MIPVKVQPELPDWAGDHMRRYLASNGEEGYYVDFRAIGGYELTPTLLLTTTGRKSGKAHTQPLIYGDIGGKRVIVASLGGAPRHPAWYLNLCAHPEVEVQVMAQCSRARARTASGAERAGLWKEMAAIYPPYEQYRQMTTREIPVVVLEPMP
jgi:deazaflavin-dependent oxidoreductase (nitroreductase family)